MGYYGDLNPPYDQKHHSAGHVQGEKLGIKLREGRGRISSCYSQPVHRSRIIENTQQKQDLVLE